jgi:hypothetical protein
MGYKQTSATSSADLTGVAIHYNGKVYDIGIDTLTKEQIDVFKHYGIVTENTIVMR